MRESLYIAGHTPNDSVPDDSAEDVLVFPTSFAQQRLWFLRQLEPDSAFYNIPAALHLTGTLDVEALEASLHEIVRRHEALRTCFAMIDGNSMQVVFPSPHLSALPVIDLSALPAAKMEGKIQKLAAEDAQQAFNLEQWPLLRTKLLRIGDDEHVLLVTMHHIISDGWSMGVFLHELTTLYEAFSTGHGPDLPELQIQYADYAQWERERLRGEVLEEQLSYWREQLRGAPPVLELPTDYPRPAVQSYRGEAVSFSLPGPLVESLRLLSRRHGGTLFITLLTAFQTLLQRYTGQEEIVVGTPVANRNRAEIEPLIGFFVNTLVLRASFAGEPSFSQMLERVREVVLEGQAHQELPFEKLVEELEVERSLRHTPLFPVMFVMLNTPSYSLDSGGVKMQPLEIKSGMAKFDLTILMNDDGERLSGSLAFSADLFEMGTIRRLLTHFETMLHSIAADPNQPISDIPLLSEDERHQLLIEWNDTRAAYPSGCMHELFEAQAARTPDRTAVVFQHEHLTYAELSRRANQFATYLRKLGVRRETLVGLMVSRSVEMVVGLLGILKAGGAYVPLDPGQPGDRLSFMLADAQISVLLTHSFRAAVMPSHEATVVCLDTDWEMIISESADNPDNHTTPDNLAYVIYTSGSTGWPKGVAIQHQSLVNLAISLQTAIYSTFKDRQLIVGLNASLAFDASVKQILTLVYGHTLNILPDDIRVDGQAFLAYMRHHVLDAFDCTPSQLALLIEAGLLDEMGHSPALVLIGGETITDSMWKALSCSQRIDFYNVYGPTECTVDSTLCLIDSTSAQPTIGRGVANTELYVLDRQMGAVPVGVIGELWIGGKGLARGYQERAELTAEKFMPHPFSRAGGERLYRTGDLARYLGDGRLEYMGRADQQVKVRGYRIELGEIEAKLGSHRGVAQCAVERREDEEGQARLVAYVVVRDGESGAEAGELRRYLQEQLPGYMIPAAYVRLEQMPLTPSGKINRRGLPAPEAAAAGGGEPGEWETPVEELVGGIWMKLLGLERLGVSENFFELGGHSLLATQVMSRVREVFGVELRLRELFERPTVKGLARAVEEGLGAGRVSGRVKRVEAQEREQKRARLSFAQQRLWFLDQLEAGSSFYHIAGAVRLRGELKVAALEQSFREVVRRHESLRTSFRSRDGEPEQVIGSGAEFAVEYEDLSELGESEREKGVQEVAAAEAGRPF